VVPIFTYRDERKLFTIIGGIVFAVVIILLQTSSARTGKSNPIADAFSSVLAVGQIVVSAVTSGVGTSLNSIIAVPRLWHENADLLEHNRDLASENTQLREELSARNDERDIKRVAASIPRGIIANTIAYDPESQSRVITIDRGSMAGILPDEGVINDEGIVGRVTRVAPFTSTVLLITDPAGKVPAVVQRGRWWGIAAGTNGRVQLEYISQDAPLRIGDLVVTGRGLSFQAGLPIGRIKTVYHSEGALYQTALIETAVSFGRLGRVLVLPK
jgi:rod shape-determining protein MreC